VIEVRRKELIVCSKGQKLTSLADRPRIELIGRGSSSRDSGHKQQTVAQNLQSTAPDFGPVWMSDV
jgi:hypothetical protein